MADRLINGCDTQANPCSEMDFGTGTGETKTVPSLATIQRALANGQRAMIVAPTGKAADAMRAHLANAGITLISIDDLPKAGEGGIAVVAQSDILPGTSFGDMLDITERNHNPDFEHSTRGWMTVFDEIDHLACADRIGIGKSAMVRSAHDDLFSDEAIAAERRARSTVILRDEEPMMRALARKALSVSHRSSFDPGHENDAFNRRQGTRGRPTRGRYKG